jgi:hypothetical protein
VQLRNLENGQTSFISSTNWSTNSFTSLPVLHFPAGWSYATMFVNGIQSTSVLVNISVPVPTSPILYGTALTNGSLRCFFTNSVGALFGALATTNLLLPVTNWTAVGGIIEVSPGQFQFTGLPMTNMPRQFYQVFSP